MAGSRGGPAAERPRMNLGPYRFCPPWWGVLLAGVAVVVFCSLGVWQIERAHYKEQRVAVQQAARQLGTQPMAPKDATSRGNGRAGDWVYGHHYVATGHFDTAHQILLSDQMHGPRNGFRVWTPLVLDNGIRVIVDRGWIPKPDATGSLPNPAAPRGPVRVTGRWHGFPRPALQWGESSSCQHTDWPQALNYPDAAAVRCQYGAPVVNGLLLMDPDNPAGFVREWQQTADPVGLRPFGHYAYASQWFLMALVSGVILVVVNLQRR